MPKFNPRRPKVMTQITRAILEGDEDALITLLPRWSARRRSGRDSLRLIRKILLAPPSSRIALLEKAWTYTGLAEAAQGSKERRAALSALMTKAIQAGATECLPWLHEKGVRVPPLREDKLPEGVSIGRSGFGLAYDADSAYFHKSAMARNRYERAVFSSLIHGRWPSLEVIDPIDLFEGTLQPDQQQSFGYSGCFSMGVLLFHLFDVFARYPERRPGLLQVAEQMALHPYIQKRQQHVCGEASMILTAGHSLETLGSLEGAKTTTYPLLVHMFKVGLLTPTYQLPYVPQRLSFSLWKEEERGENLLREAYIESLSIDLQANTQAAAGAENSAPTRL